jgi:hypothetical protein
MGGIDRGLELPFLQAAKSRFLAQPLDPVNSNVHRMSGQVFLQAFRAVALLGLTMAAISTSRRASPSPDAKAGTHAKHSSCFWKLTIIDSKGNG